MGTGNTTFPSPNALATPNVSNVSIAVATINLQRAGLYVFNPSSTVTLWVTPQNPPNAPITPAVANGAGCITIQPLQGVMFGPPNTPAWTSGMNCIASAPGANVIAILEYYS
jgi:hypothetical protein